LRRLVGWVAEAFGRTCCRETIRRALHRLELSWKKARKLLGRADPQRREAFIARAQDLLAGAQQDRHRLVYLDEAHIHQDADLGYGWSARIKMPILATAGRRASRCRSWLRLVGARPALLGRLALPASCGQALLLWALSLQRG
jgi:hypothetical protein